jgi:hypothetical protein
MDQIGNLENSLPIKIKYDNSVSDRNQDWVRFLLGVWIRIRNQKDPDPRKQKEPTYRMLNLELQQILQSLFGLHVT